MLRQIWYSLGDSNSCYRPLQAAKATAAIKTYQARQRAPIRIAQLGLCRGLNSGQIRLLMAEKEVKNRENSNRRTSALPPKAAVRVVSYERLLLTQSRRRMLQTTFPCSVLAQGWALPDMGEYDLRSKEENK